MSGFHWLDEFLASIGAEKFCLFDRTSSSQVGKFESEHGRLPPSYRSYFQAYGAAKLMRDYERGNYPLKLYASPKQVSLVDDVAFYCLGIDQGESIYLVRESDGFGDSILRHMAAGGIRETGMNFEQWLRHVIDREWRK